jgi:hypothetical protein
MIKLLAKLCDWAHETIYWRGKYFREWWWHNVRPPNKEMWARGLKKGDLVAHCCGWNCIIDDFKYNWGWEVSEQTPLGERWHALHGCCSKAESLDEIKSFWIDQVELKPTERDWFPVKKLKEALKAGKEPFDRNGCLRDEYYQED